MSWQTLGSVVDDFWSPWCQGVALQLSHVDSSLALWEGGAGGGDPSFCQLGPDFLLVAVAAWHEIVLSF